jgi:hypothetical protein
MPKSSVRCIDKHLRMGHGCHYPTAASHVQSGSMPGSFLLSAPRKISFEDNRSGSDSNPSICRDDTRIPIKNNKTETIKEHCPVEERRRRRGEGTNPPTMIRRKRSLLVRPTTSLSLVDLAKSVPQEANVDGDDSYRDEEEEQHIEERKAKRIRSFNVSPRSIVRTESNLSSSSDVDKKHQPSGNSNWGHFVNMVVDDEDDEEEEYHRNFLITPSSSSCDANANANANAVLEHYRKPFFRSSCNELSCHRVRRRHSPYAEYKNYRRAREAMKPDLSFIHHGLYHHTDDSLNLDTTYSMHGCQFHSSPTRRTGKNKGGLQEQTTEQLIGAFSELQLRKQHQNACVQQQQNRC